MNNIIFLISLTFMTSSVFCQLKSEIKNIKVGNISIKKNEDVDVEDEEEGPNIGITFNIRNLSNKTDIKLLEDYYSFFICFKYKRKDYRVNVDPIILNNSSVLYRKSKLVFFVSSYFLLNTPIHRDKKYDYVYEMLEILPTLRMYFKQKKHEVYSNKIENVEIL